MGEFNTGRHEKETAAAATRQTKLTAYAQDLMDTLKKKDEDRRVAAQAAEDASFAQLQTASSVKDAAQADADKKAEILRDALATQAKYQPQVDDMLATSLGENKAALDTAAANIGAKESECKAFLTEVKALLEA